MFVVVRHMRLFSFSETAPPPKLPRILTFEGKIVLNPQDYLSDYRVRLVTYSILQGGKYDI
jgi:hypothetical protein